MRLPKVERAFRRLRAEVRELIPDFLVELGYAPESDFPEGRSFAWCRPDREGDPQIAVATRLEQQSGDRIEAVLRHEFGHALDFWLDPADAAELFGLLPSTVERRADALAAAVWGEPILYDADEVQSLRTGVHPRPAHLGL